MLTYFGVEEQMTSINTRAVGTGTAGTVKCDGCGDSVYSTHAYEYTTSGGGRKVLCPDCFDEATAPHHATGRNLDQGRGAGDVEGWPRTITAVLALILLVLLMLLWAGTAGEGGTAGAQGLSNPACVGFNPYQWSNGQITNCTGVPPAPGPGPHFLPQATGQYPDWRGQPAKVQAWANVLVGLSGLDNDYDAYLSLENDTDPNTAIVIIRGAAGGAITKLVHLDPEQRVVVKFNDLGELQGQLPIGVSVRVKWMKEGNAGVSMHRARDFGQMVQAQEGQGGRK